MIPATTAATILDHWDRCQVHAEANPATGRTYAAVVYLMRRKGEPDRLFATPYLYRTPERAEQVLTAALDDLRQRYPNPDLLRRRS